MGFASYGRPLTTVFWENAAKVASCKAAKQNPHPCPGILHSPVG